MRHSLRKKSASLNPPSKLLCRDLAITELSVDAIIQPLCVVNWISVLNKTWNTCIYALAAVSITACILAPASLFYNEISWRSNTKNLTRKRSLTIVAFIWVLFFIRLISHVSILIMACLCLVTLSFSCTQKFSSHCLITKFNFQAWFLEKRAKQFH